MIRPKYETEDLSLSITKICETLIKRTHIKPKKSLELKLTQSRVTLSFTPPSSIEGSRMIRLTTNRGLQFYF